jgi:HEAT repeat protein
MKLNRRSKKKSTQSPATEPAQRRPGKRFEWPLLIFPAALVTTLIVLYLLNQSIQQGSVRPAGEEATSHETRPADAGQPDEATSASDTQRQPGTRVDAGPQTQAPQINERPAAATGREKPELESRRVIAKDEAGRSAGAPELDNVGKILLVLQEAIEAKDHARIKQCLDDLVALGDQVIAPLMQVIANEQGEAGMWAAEALARIGTPLATTTLLETLAQVKEGPYKVELGKRVAGISNHDSWPVLLDNIMSTSDSTVLRSATESLSRMADAPIIDELVARYDGAANERDAERITQLISNIHSTKATESLLSLAGDVASSPQDGLSRAAIQGLANSGDPQAVSYLMRKLEASAPGEGGYLVNAISQIKEPQAQDALLYAAAGNKEVSAENGRTAAIYALRNYPNDKTVTLLEQIVASEENARVSAAATRTLDDIRKTSPHVVADARSLVKKDPYAPQEPVKK